MRIIFFCLLFIGFVGCKKDNFTAAPQLTYKSLSPNYWETGLSILYKDFAPVVTMEITDAEGDFGSDSSGVYVKNILTGTERVYDMPSVGSYAGGNVKAELKLNLYNSMQSNCINGTGGNAFDTIYYEIYVRDNAGNKSNVVRTPDPVFHKCF